MWLKFQGMYAELSKLSKSSNWTASIRAAGRKTGVLVKT
jgi:hypothetical protein